MQYRLRRALALAVTLVAPAASAVHAQQPAPPSPNDTTYFTYRDSDGVGRLAVTDLGPDAATGGRQVRVTLQQGGANFFGSGFMLPLETTSPFTTLVTFSLVAPWGTSYFFQGKTISGITLSGQGTYHRVGFPEQKESWSILIGGPGGDIAPTSGIRGVAMAGPIFPVERPGIPNSRPLPGAIITVQPPGGGSEITRQRADANGRFQIPLPPGSYLIVPLPPQPEMPLPRAEPRTVTVHPNRFLELTIEYDTGIR